MGRAAARTRAHSSSVAASTRGTERRGRVTTLYLLGGVMTSATVQRILYAGGVTRNLEPSFKIQTPTGFVAG